METLLKVDLSTIKEQTGGVLNLTEELHLPAQETVEFPEPVTVHVQVNRPTRLLCDRQDPRTVRCRATAAWS